MRHVTAVKKPEVETRSGDLPLRPIATLGPGQLQRPGADDRIPEGRPIALCTHQQRSRRSRVLIQILLEADEGKVDFCGLAAKVGLGIGEGVVVLEPEQRRELFLVEFFDTDGNVVLEDEIEEDLLLGVEMRVDMHFRIRGPDFTGDRW